MERDVGTTRRSKCPDVLEMRRMFSGSGYFIEADVARHPVECRHPPWSDVRRGREQMILNVLSRLSTRHCGL